jgi:hypothetical protein
VGRVRDHLNFLASNKHRANRINNKKFKLWEIPRKMKLQTLVRLFWEEVLQLKPLLMLFHLVRINRQNLFHKYLVEIQPLSRLQLVKILQETVLQTKVPETPDFVHLAWQCWITNTNHLLKRKLKT